METPSKLLRFLKSFFFNIESVSPNSFLRKCSDSWWSQMLPEKHQSKFHQFTVSSLDKKKWFKPGTDKQCVVHIYRLHMWKVFWQSKYEDNKSQQSTYFDYFSSAFFCSISNRENGETFRIVQFWHFSKHLSLVWLHHNKTFVPFMNFENLVKTMLTTWSLFENEWKIYSLDSLNVLNTFFIVFLI